MVIPKEQAEKAHLKPGDKVELIILKKKNPIKETFGTFKFSRPIEEIMREADKESWDE